MTAARPIFLLSLPRSGSTLLQRLVGSHPDVATAPEPWVLLPLLSAVRPDDVFAGYSHRTAAVAIGDFTERLDGGPARYREAVRDVALRLYGEAAGGRSWFLDKTPRYSLVVDELLDTFADSPVISLWRNPLAVLASLSTSWAEGRWQPHLHKIDLYDALERLTAAVERRPERFVDVRYEDLIARPEQTCEALFARLGLAPAPGVVTAFAELRLDGKVGDRWGSRAYDRVSADPLEKWRAALASPVRVAWCRRYLRWIGRDRLALMGYDLPDLLGQLDAVEPRWSAAAPDLLSVGRGVVSDLVEPPLLREKLRSVRQWRRVHRHT